MNLINFIEEYPDELSCKQKFKEIRDKEGIVCRKCNSKDHYWQASIWQYQCKQCGTRTTLRSGTVMQASKLPFRYWFIAIHLLTVTKKTFSALELQRQLGHKFYEPVWYMMQKLRKTMGIRDQEYQLDKIVELDEGFFESVDTEKSKEDEKDEKLKRGRGSQRQTKVIVMASTAHTLTVTKEHKKPTKLRYVKMVVVNDLKARTIEKEVRSKIKRDSLIKTDNFKSYSNIHNLVWVHQAQTLKPKEASKILPWVHTMISNAKRNLLGIHHMISKKYFQDYIDEYCYKVNRRYFGENLFDRLLVACVSYNYKNYVNVIR
jgi:transposase-like protein/DNA-directed RNA polymerase subunit RPC12/RpoP